MKTETIVMCVVALILGMLLANMLKSVCGCKTVEGYKELPVTVQAQCDGGQIRDDDGVCACPGIQKLDKNGKCVCPKTHYMTQPLYSDGGKSTCKLRKEALDNCGDELGMCVLDNQCWVEDDGKNRVRAEREADVKGTCIPNEITRVRYWDQRLVKVDPNCVDDGHGSCAVKNDPNQYPQDVVYQSKYGNK